MLMMTTPRILAREGGGGKSRYSTALTKTKNRTMHLLRKPSADRAQTGGKEDKSRPTLRASTLTLRKSRYNEERCPAEELHIDTRCLPAAQQWVHQLQKGAGRKFEVLVL
ncbi:hypothetical protein TNCV_2244401 [Trichonephila clavipes]|nr:hypothetical protein TNCV_2244401 [Trichonephila clavipes]